MSPIAEKISLAQGYLTDSRCAQPLISAIAPANPGPRCNFNRRPALDPSKGLGNVLSSMWEELQHSCTRLASENGGGRANYSSAASALLKTSKARVNNLIRSCPSRLHFGL